MVQRTLSLLDTEYSNKTAASPEIVRVLGLKCDEEMVTLRFITNGPDWGQPAHQVVMDRKLAEQLARFLNDELYQN